MEKDITEAFIDLDASKDSYAVAIADNGRLFNQVSSSSNSGLDFY